MRNFVHDSHAVRTVFGVGALDGLSAELEAMGLQRVLLLCTPRGAGAAQALADAMGTRASGIFAGAAMHVPRAVVDEAAEIVRERGVEGVLAYGGGSTIGLAKALALQHPLTVIAVPTTYAGSEMTPIYGITEHGRKQTGSDRRVLPRLVLYDPALTLDLPVGVAVVSGLNALAHAAEGLYARDGNPVTDLMAQESIRVLAQGLPGLVDRPADLAARADCLYGAWLAGMVLGGVGMALHHKLCHTLGGSFGLPHAQTHAVVLPYVLAYNAPAIPAALLRIGQALGTTPAQVPAALQALAVRLGAPRSLSELGLPHDAIEQTVTLVMAQPYWNPQPLAHERLRRLMAAAHAGLMPEAVD